ncbi:MAG: hemW [Segetibacter sp.]|nr:hemW [Segetibacter sp.]
MAGIYIHIPFCRKACHYCNFHFSTSTALQGEFVNALLHEIELRGDYLQECIETIYFGGGTPSILASVDLERILYKIKAVFEVEANAEITLEANPDDITAEKLEQWKAIGINRLSIGIQSFFEEDLKWMNRAHNAEQAITCIVLAQAHGFFNLTIDLIYGTPSLTDEKWRQNVVTAVSLNIPHLSCYALTVEPKTALQKLIEQKKLENVDQEKQAKHFELLMQWTNEAGFEHYEISNFAKPGFRSRHNSSYWRGNPYLGLGPSAHSFNGESRQWNIANNALYIKSIGNNTVPCEVETLTVKERLNEYLMTGLRTIEGVELARIEKDFGEDVYKRLLENASGKIENGFLAVADGHLRTTTEGKLLVDGIASDLFQL